VPVLKQFIPAGSQTQFLDNGYQFFYFFKTDKFFSKILIVFPQKFEMKITQILQKINCSKSSFNFFPQRNKMKIK
jgi:hypothetical protein